MSVKIFSKLSPLATSGLVIAAALVLSSCAQVKPWQRGTLGKYEMALTPDPMESTLHSHIYFSKEASSSGAAVSGGGCGCN